jgi:hypothetical protein
VAVLAKEVGQTKGHEGHQGKSERRARAVTPLQAVS